MNNADTRTMVTQLWTANFLNIRRATEVARTQARTRLDIGFELLDITFTMAGEFHPYAVDCLSHLSRSSFFAIHVWTLALPEPMATMIGQLNASQVFVRGQNENSARKNVAWNTRTPWFDVLIDTTTGFDAASGHWYWALLLFQIAEDSLSSTRSGATIIRTTERYGTAPDLALRSPQGIIRSDRPKTG